MRSLRPTAIALIASGGLILGAATPAATLGSPAAVRAQKDEVARLQARLDAIGERVADAAERYNGARWTLGQIRERLEVNRTVLAKAIADLGTSQQILSGRLEALYRRPDPNLLEIVVSSGSLADAVGEVEAIERAGGADARLVGRTRALRDRTIRIRRELAADREAAKVEVQRAAAERERVEAILVERREVLANAKADLRQAIADEAARRRAAALAARAGRAGLVRSDRPAYTGPLPSGGGNAEAVRIMLSFQGVPYVWGGESPSGFDCSGLATYAYRQIGKTVPHYTYAIWDAFPKVPRDQLQPGDMVFFRGLGHMGIYIGDGKMVHAPQTGDVVHVRDMSYRSDYVGAVRP